MFATRTVPASADLHSLFPPTSSVSSASTANSPTRRICCKTSSTCVCLPDVSLCLFHTLTLFKERKYFDSGDYALSKAGKASDTGVTTIGTEHPTADAIPHMSPLTNTLTRGDSISAGSPPSISSPVSAGAEGMPAGLHRGSINGIPGGGQPGHTSSRSPVKESSYLARSASIDEGQDGVKEGSGANTLTTSKSGSMSPPPRKEGIPIRR